MQKYAFKIFIICFLFVFLSLVLNFFIKTTSKESQEFDFASIEKPRAPQPYSLENITDFGLKLSKTEQLRKISQETSRLLSLQQYDVLQTELEQLAEIPVVEDWRKDRLGYVFEKWWDWAETWDQDKDKKYTLSLDSVVTRL